jgi:hypothetical protein
MRVALKYAGLAAVLVALSAFVTGCASLSTPIERMQYPSDVRFYPAVYGVVKEYLPKAKYLDIDFYNNIYKITNIQVYDLLTTKKFDIVIKLMPDGIDITYENIYDYDDINYRWQESHGFTMYDFNKLASRISTKMVDIANDPSLYEENEKAAMADIYFIYAVVKNMTDIAFKDFINEYAKNSIFNIEGSISDVEEVNKEIDGKVYKYAVSVTMSLAENDSYSNSFNDDKIYCDLYTNKTEVIRLTKSSVYSVKALLAGANRSTVGSNMFIDLVDADD